MSNPTTTRGRHRAGVTRRASLRPAPSATAADRREPSIVLVLGRSDDASGQLTLTLHQAGYWVTHTDSHEEAAQSVRTLRPDAIVVAAPDAQMLSALEAMGPDANPTCVVASTPLCPEELLRDVRLAVRAKRR